MSGAQAQLRRIAVRVDETRVDLVVPSGSALAHALAAAGIRLAPGDRVFGPGGVPVRPETPYSELHEGGLYMVASLAAGAREPSKTAVGGAAATALSWALVTAASVLALLVGAAGSDAWRWSVFGVLASAAILVALQAGLNVQAASRATVFLPPLVLGAAAGSLTVAGAQSAGGIITCAMALAGAALAAVIMAATARTTAARAAASSATVVLALAAIGAAASGLISWGPIEFSIVMSAAAILAIRALPALMVVADEGYFIDYDRFMPLRWTVRSRVPRYIERVSTERVTDFVGVADLRLRVTILLLAVLAVPGVGAAVVPAATGNLVARIGASAFLVLALAALLLVARRTPAPGLRLPQQIAALVAAVSAALVSGVTGALGGAAVLGVAGVLALAGTVAAVMIVPIGRGAHSLGWSRTGDIVAAIAVVLILPTGLLAAGAIDVLRGVLV